MLLSFPWPVACKDSVVQVARQRGWMTCLFQEADRWPLEPSDIAVGRVNMEWVVKWEGMEELSDACRRMVTLQEYVLRFRKKAVGVERWPGVETFLSLRFWLSTDLPSILPLIRNAFG